MANLPRPSYEADQFRLSQSMRDDASRFAPVVQRRLADVADPQSRLMVARGRGNADMMQRMGPDTAAMTPLERTTNTPFARVMQRSRALSRIGMMGENAVYQQQFRDRVGLATIGQQFRANQAGDLSQLSKMQAETTAARMRADQSLGAARAGALGSIAGGVARGLQGYSWGGGADTGTPYSQDQAVQFNQGNPYGVGGGPGIYS